MDPLALLAGAATFASLLVAVVVALFRRRKPHRRPVPLSTHSTSRVVRSLVTQYVARAELWQRISQLTLGAICAVVIVGVVVFVTAGSVLELLPSKEIELRVRIEEIEKESQKRRESTIRAESELVELERLQELWIALEQSALTAQEVHDKQSSDDRTAAIYAAEGAKVLAAIERDSNVDVNMAKFYFAHRKFGMSGRFSKRIVAAARRECEAAKIPVPGLQSLLMRIAKSSENGFAVEADEVEMLNQIRTVTTTINQRLSEKFEEVTENRASALEKEEQRVIDEEEKERLEKEVDKLSDARDSILFMAWLPDLTIRIGAVILLLFLAGVGAATYRYTLSLSAFYFSRADALRLVFGDEEAMIDSEQLSALVKDLSPDALSVESTMLPYEALANLIRRS